MVEVLPSLQADCAESLLSKGKYLFNWELGVIGDSIELGVTLVAAAAEDEPPPGFPGLLGSITNQVRNSLTVILNSINDWLNQLYSVKGVYSISDSVVNFGAFVPDTF